MMALRNTQVLNMAQPAGFKPARGDPFAHAPIKELTREMYDGPQKYTSSQHKLLLLLLLCPFDCHPFNRDLGVLLGTLVVYNGV